MRCEERNKLLNEYDVANGKVVPFPESTQGVPQSYADVAQSQQLLQVLHVKSAALADHDKTHGCNVAATKN